jgi:hypothetical protein
MAATFQPPQARQFRAGFGKSAPFSDREWTW